MAKKKDNLDWMRAYRTHRGIIEGVHNDEKVGKAFRLALQYFDQKGEGLAEIYEEIGNDEITQMLFGAFKQGADDSIKSYAESVEAGHKGAEAKKEKQAQKEKELQDQIDYLMKMNGGDEPTPNAPRRRKEDEFPY